MKKYAPEDFLNHRKEIREFYDPASGEVADVSRGAIRAIDLLMHAAGRQGRLVILSFTKNLEVFLAKCFESYHLREGLAGHIKDTFRDQNAELSPEIVAKSFPLAPLSTSYPFVSSSEESFAAERIQAPISDAKVMPKRSR